MEEGLNSLFIQWLSEWRENAKQSGSKLEFVYGKALKSLRAHEAPLTSGAELRKLKGFGDKLCAQIDKRKLKHFGGQEVAIVGGNQTPTRQITPSISTLLSVRKRGVSTPNKATPPVRKVSRVHRYIPAQGSSGFAILVSLLRYELEFSMPRVNKLDLQDMCQQYTTSLTAASNQRYSGWNTIKTLINRELVSKTEGRSNYYSLTEDGRKLATKLALVCPSLQDFANEYLKSTSQATTESAETVETEVEDSQASTVPEYQSFILEKGNYDIVLCIDSRERISTNFCKENRAAFATALQKQDLNVEIRTLPLGDFVWIAREKSRSEDLLRFHSCTQQSASSDIRRELVLDVIVERKRIDDLASSIRDHRWDEQKHRLRNCGLRKPTYLIEYIGKGSRKNEYGGLKPETLDQAIANCEIDGFDVKRTESFDETIRYLAFLTRWIERYYSDKSIISCASKEDLSKTCAMDLHYITFNEFAVNASKVHSFTVKEMFVKQLVQIKGLSMAKVNAIVDRYPTMISFLKAYHSKPDLYARHNLLTDLKCDSLTGPSKRLGPALSKKICNYYYRP